MAQIALDGVGKVYADGTEAVSNLDLDIGDGEFMVLVGPSGCGKTTALRMVAGLEEISRGTVTIGDRVVNDLAAEGPQRRDGVPELRAVSPPQRVREHGVRPAAAQDAKGRDTAAGTRGRRRPRPRGAPRPQAEEPLRRPAPAGRDGPRDRPRAGRLPDGRAAVEPGREAPGADARRDLADPGGSRTPRRSTSRTTRWRR